MPFKWNSFFLVFKLFYCLCKLHDSEYTEVVLDKSVSFWLYLKNVFRVEHYLDGLHPLSVVGAVVGFIIQFSKADYWVTTDFFAEGLLPHGYQKLVMFWRHSEKRCSRVNNSLGNICRALKLRHLIIIEEPFNINSPPLVINLFEWHKFLYSSFDLWTIPLAKGDVRSLVLLR